MIYLISTRVMNALTFAQHQQLITKTTTLNTALTQINKADGRIDQPEMLTAQQLQDKVAQTVLQISQLFDYEIADIDQAIAALLQAKEQTYRAMLEARGQARLDQ